MFIEAVLFHSFLKSVFIFPELRSENVVVVAGDDTGERQAV